MIFARTILYCVAASITLGGLYDVFVPALPSNLLAMCGDEAMARKLTRELLRALGGALVAVGATVAVLVSRLGTGDRRPTLILVLLLVLPSEGVNALSMRRVGSPFLIPLGFASLATLGVLLAWRA